MVDLRFTRSAIRSLRRFAKGDPKSTAALRAAIDRPAANPADPALDVARLQGREGFRLRVGGYRAIFTRDGDTITVVDVGLRGGIYRR